MADNNGLTPEQIAEQEAAAAAKAVKDAEAEAERARIAQEEENARLARMTQAERDSDMVKKLVQERLDAELAPIKGNLDKAYAARDAALKKIAEFEQKEKEATLKKLEEEGKFKEAADLRVAEANARIAALEKHNTELSRDVQVRDALKSYQFRNDKASEMAYKEIVGNLVQNEAGLWVHRSGISIRDYCDAFSRDEEQSFLFKAKVNTGGGSPAGGSGNGDPAKDTGKKSLFKMTQAEVLKLAAEGKL